jgi:hypothetical protein
MILIAVPIAVLLLIVLFGVLFYKLASRFDAQACNPEWLENFSLEKYTPMERLLDKSDFEYLGSQPGYRAEVGNHLLAERRKVFAGYLRLLTRDFNQLLRIAKLMLVYSTEERPELANALFRQQVTFYLAICAVRCKIALMPLGSTNVDVPRLVSAVGNLRDQISNLGMLHASAGASA